jgi:hypothetical protein
MRPSLGTRSELGYQELTNGSEPDVSAAALDGLPDFLGPELNTNIYEHNPKHTGA